MRKAFPVKGVLFLMARPFIVEVLRCRYYVKSAQILASKGDFLPEQWVHKMTPIFFDSMKPHPWQAIKKVQQQCLSIP